MNREIGFFDVDCRELNAAGTGLGYRPRVEPIVPALEKLYARARELDAPEVFTTCCSGRMLREASLSEVLFVPMDPAQSGWTARVPAHRLFYLEKATCGVPAENYKQRTFDAFRYNRNAPRLFELLGARRWVVFGNGFDLCVNTTVRGLLGCGLAVHLIADVTVAAARGYDDCGTEENRRRVLEDLAGLGATVGTLAEFLEAGRP